MHLSSVIPWDFGLPNGKKPRNASHNNLCLELPLVLFDLVGFHQILPFAKKSGPRMVFYNHCFTSSKLTRFCFPRSGTTKKAYGCMMFRVGTSVWFSFWDSGNLKGSDWENWNRGAWLPVGVYIQPKPWKFRVLIVGGELVPSKKKKSPRRTAKQ